jgi:hypothetical protein
MKKKGLAQPPRRDAQISFKIPTATKDALTEAARKDKRSVSALAMVILEEWLEQHGK